MGAILNFIIVLLAAALVIYIVGRLNLGLGVASYSSAIIAALVIAVIAVVINWLLGLLGIDPATMGGLLGWIINIIIAAVVLILGARFLPGLTVNGFGGAVIAAIAIGVVGWLLNWVLGLFGISI
jgi:putative membrane protein